MLELRVSEVGACGSGNPLAMTDKLNTHVDLLADKLGCPWPSIFQARQAAAEQRGKISKLLGEQKLTSDDAVVVIFGSLARGEWTSGSDVDWTLLIDGLAIPEHRQTAQGVGRVVEKAFKEPAAVGAFGNMTFSHDLIHLIGGQDDTNANTTRRVLLLLESAPIRFPNAENGGSGAYDRVVRGILSRYLGDDTNLMTEHERAKKVPRFLLNDIVRFWRTMCVDFAWKGWEQAGKKWALRNIKLRMSRKLMFASGLLMCANGYMDQELAAPMETSDDEPDVAPLLDRLQQLVARSPLDIVAEALNKYASDETSRKLFDAYNAFLAILDDEEKRKELEGLAPSDAYTNPIFNDARDHSHKFQGALADLCFNSNRELSDFTTHYGVF